ncbi:unnamed protein product [Rotaria magnacalcarata]|uniref:Uncharacterized protein n=1 Tax=Rotaria magnacalcarata TaxID=392030 RepID=A0A820DA24_9BILA|nr:unnamed protein product [Rotaria magnacalcarata]
MYSIPNKESLTIKTIQSATNDKIGLLNDLIDHTTDLKELIEYHKSRFLIHYEENRYKDALHDIGVLHRYPGRRKRSVNGRIR